MSKQRNRRKTQKANQTLNATAAYDPNKVKGNLPNEEKAVQQCRQWYDGDKNAKKFYVDEMKEMYKLYKCDHWDLTGPGGVVLRTVTQQQNRPNSVENITFALIEGNASEFAKEVELVDIPKEQDDEEAATVMTELKKHIFYKNKINNERIKGLRWFFLYGTLIKHPHWDPDWSGGRGPNRWVGDIRWKVLHPMMLVPDARCKEDINEGNRCHKVIWHTLESVQEKYPDRAHLVQYETISDDDFIDIGEVDSEGYGMGDAKQDQVPIIETWYKGRPLILGENEKDLGTGLHIIWWAGEDQGIYLRHSNYINYEPNETVYFPFILKQCYPREGSVWGFGEAYFLKNPQIIYNKTAETILESHLHGAFGQTFYNENALTDKQKKIVKEKGTLPGMWIAVKDPQGINRLYGQTPPATLQVELKRLRDSMEGIIGRHDISQGKAPTGVTAYKAIEALQARAQVRLRIKEMAITAAYEEAGQYCNTLIERYYTEQRKYRILGKDGFKYGTYNIEDMLRVYNSNTHDVKTFKELSLNYAPEMNPEDIARDLHDRGMEIYFPEFDSECKVTSVMPTDRLYHMEMAKELLTAQIIDIETFFYTMEHGHLPPWEELVKKITARQEAEARERIMQTVNQVLQSLPAEMQERFKALNPDKQQEIVQLLAREVTGGESPQAGPQ